MFKEKDRVKWLYHYDAEIMKVEYNDFKDEYLYLIKIEESGNLYTAFEEDLQLL